MGSEDACVGIRPDQGCPGGAPDAATVSLPSDRRSPGGRDLGPEEDSALWFLPSFLGSPTSVSIPNSIGLPAAGCPAKPFEKRNPPFRKTHLRPRPGRERRIRQKNRFQQPARSTWEARPRRGRSAARNVRCPEGMSVVRKATSTGHATAWLPAIRLRDRLRSATLQDTASACRHNAAASRSIAIDAARLHTAGEAITCLAPGRCSSAASR